MFVVFKTTTVCRLQKIFLDWLGYLIVKRMICMKLERAIKPSFYFIFTYLELAVIHRPIELMGNIFVNYSINMSYQVIYGILHMSGSPCLLSDRLSSSLISRPYQPCPRLLSEEVSKILKGFFIRKGTRRLLSCIIFVTFFNRIGSELLNSISLIINSYTELVINIKNMLIILTMMQEHGVPSQSRGAFFINKKHPQDIRGVLWTTLL